MSYYDWNQFHVVSRETQIIIFISFRFFIPFLFQTPRVNIPRWNCLDNLPKYCTDAALKPLQLRRVEFRSVSPGCHVSWPSMWVLQWSSLIHFQHGGVQFIILQEQLSTTCAQIHWGKFHDRLSTWLVLIRIRSWKICLPSTTGWMLVGVMMMMIKMMWMRGLHREITGATLHRSTNIIY